MPYNPSLGIAMRPICMIGMLIIVMLRSTITTTTTTTTTLYFVGPKLKRKPSPATVRELLLAGLKSGAQDTSTSTNTSTSTAVRHRFQFPPCSRNTK